jgi:thiol-disulfide isomerase/thioredoxin
MLLDRDEFLVTYEAVRIDTNRLLKTVKASGYAAQVVADQPVSVAVVMTALPAGFPLLDAALAEARAENKPIVLDLNAAWCAPCRKLERLTFPDARVKPLLSQTVFLRVDTDKHPDLAQRLNVEGLPDIRLALPNGTIIRQLRSFQDAKSFAGELEKLLQLLPDTNALLIEGSGFQPAINVLKKRTNSRLSIPQTIPKSYADGKDFFCTITKSEPNEYEVIIGYAANCEGGNACRLGSLYGKRTMSENISGTDNYAFEMKEAKQVQLQKGIIGYFVDSTCGANCSDAKMFWKTNGWEYMVGLKAGKMVQLIQFANSAINNTLP